MQTDPHTASPIVPPPAFSLSESAAARINHLKAVDNKPGQRFRITVKGGGCSGFQYDFTLDDAAPSPEDSVFVRDGAEVIIDDVSLGIIKGGMLDYTEDLASAGFAIKNPNATARCGCGNSFSVSL
ncbi:MAG: iron-sulfur cluster assembly accessory protein [Pseudomonadota bacterium]|nr:iron-sulfur cluster assembly accessory protein [Pseudomonadota bacterium]